MNIRYPSTGLMFLLSMAVNAQVNWTVGVPVAFKLTELSVFGSGCTPNADLTIAFGAVMVDGVGYYAIVDAVTPPGSNTILPYGLAPLNVGDTVPLDMGGPNYCFFPSGSGSMTLSLWALGTPATAGQVHPCVYTTFWLSDIMICPEGLSTVLSNTCTVQAQSTGLGSVTVPSGGVTLPGPGNGWILRIADPAVTRTELINACGSLATATTNGSIDVGTVPDGLYFLRLTSDRDTRTQRVVITR